MSVSTSQSARHVTAVPTTYCAASSQATDGWPCPPRPTRSTRSALAHSVISSLSSSGTWSAWLAVETRLVGFASLEEALDGWRRRDSRCYQVVAGLTALGSRRGGDDDDAALAVVVLLGDGISRVAMTLSDVCELDDLNATVWEEVKAAEPQTGPHAARYLLQRARQRLSRPAAGMVSRVATTSLDQTIEANGDLLLSTHSEHDARQALGRDLRLATPEVEQSAADLADLLAWATGVGAISPTEVDLIVELIAAENDGLPREEAQRLVGERRGLTMRTVRRRRDATTTRLREFAPEYLAAIA